MLHRSLMSGTNSMNNRGTRQDRHCTANCLKQSSYLHFQVWGEKVNYLQFQFKCKQQLLIYLQNHQAIFKFSQFIFHCTGISESVSSPGLSSTDYLVFHMHCGSGCVLYTLL